MNAALVPVQRLGAGKSRLAGALAREATDALALAMLGDVLDALHGVRAVDAIFVVTPDASVGDAAVAGGAEALLRDDPGLNPSLDAAARILEARGAASLLVLLGDVPGAHSAEIARLYPALAELGGRGAVLAPAADGGTAALLRAPVDVLPSRFGPDSARAHTEAARAAEVPFLALPLPSLALDLDRPEDLRALAARDDAAAPRTRALLARLGVGAAS